MATVLGLQCVRCGARYPADHFAEDCPACRPVARSNLVVVYDAALRTARAKPAADAERGMWRYGDLLPVDQAGGVSLGEGGSPLHRLDRAGSGIGVANWFAKDETRNPTWSFKDRVAWTAGAPAKKMGVKVIVSSSSGNAGAAGRWPRYAAGPAEEL